jgi:hypothetical protein
VIGKRLPVPLPVPDWSKPIIAALLLVALWFGVRSRRAATRAKRLERQDAVLVADKDAMQAALVPEVPARLEGVPVSVAYRPADGPAAGGDFYDVFVPRPGTLAVVVGDVCGHGRTALRHAALCRYTLRAYLQAGLEPRAALALAGRVLVDTPPSNYATVALALYDAHSGTLTYAGAGHPPPIIYGFRAHPPVVKGASPPIGWGLPTGRRQTQISLPPGGAACFFSDGLTDARRAGKPLGRERLVEILGSLGTRAGAAQLVDEVRSVADSTPDDMAACILAPETLRDATYAQVEELEADERTLSGTHVRAFLEECRLPPAGIADAMKLARRLAADSETVLFAVRVAPAGATAVVTPCDGGAREATSPRPHPLRLPAHGTGPLLEPSPGT